MIDHLAQDTMKRAGYVRPGPQPRGKSLCAQTSIQISLIFFLFLILGFQKRIASICLQKIHKGYTFLKAQNEKQKNYKTNLN